MRFATVKANTEKTASAEVSMAHFIPYRCHWNNNTLLTYKDELVRIVKIKGFAFETADDEEVDLKKNSRNNLLKAMSSGNFSLYFHTIRRKEKGSSPLYCICNYWSGWHCGCINHDRRQRSIGHMVEVCIHFQRGNVRTLFIGHHYP